MTIAQTIRGGSPVAMLDALPEPEARLVRYLRGWCAGPEGQAGVWNEMAVTLGAPGARAGLAALEALLALFLDHGRRPLMRHHPDCSCVGADEAAFAEFVGLAAEGAREDAMMLAALMIRADMLMQAVGLAETLGLSLRRMALRRAADAADTIPAPASPVRH